MVDASLVTEWLTKAAEDLEFGRINLEERKNFFAQICFHFQQAAEKYLKAFIGGFYALGTGHSTLLTSQSTYQPINWSTVTINVLILPSGLSIGNACFGRQSQF